MSARAISAPSSALSRSRRTDPGRRRRCRRHDGALLNVLGAVAVSLVHLDLEPIRPGFQQGAVHPQPAPGGELDGDQAHRLTGRQVPQRIALSGRCGHDQVAVKGLQESGGAAQRGGPQPVLVVAGGDHRQLAVGQKAPDTAVEARFAEHPGEAAGLALQPGAAAGRPVRRRGSSPLAPPGTP